MEHGERCGAQAIERGDAVEIADDRDDPVRAELRDFLATADESVQPRASREQRGNAERDVSTANQQYPDHKALTCRRCVPAWETLGPVLEQARCRLP